MSIWEHTVPYKRYKLAIMWSGGMDTTIAWFYAMKNEYKPEDVVMIHLAIGEPYEEKQQKAIKMLSPYIESDILMFDFDLLRKEIGNVPTPDKQIVPGRNLLIAYLGAFFADRVWLGALDGEMHRYMPDKNMVFFQLTSGILSYIMDKDIVVETPFATMSKSEVLKWMVDMYGKEYTEEVISKTVTCYDPDEWACGKCSTCFKRWIAYVNAGLDWSKYWKVNPAESEVAKSLVRKYKEAERKGEYSHYSRKRIRETFEALRKMGVEI